MCKYLVSIVGLFVIFAGALTAQTTSASLTGRVTDPSKAVITEAKITAINVGTNIRYDGTTNKTGEYDVASLPPGTYRVEVEKPGFATVIKPDVILHVQDAIEINFELRVGSTSESITVGGGASLINMQSASVSTVVDRKFVENMPLNGRSFQDLLTLSPGVALVGGIGNGGNSGVGNGGEISVNGQRTEANYFTVDGVSANTGTRLGNVIGGVGFSGSLPGETVVGTTQSLVSVDALEEFRASTSTYSAEYGRTPGGQFSFSTRAGTNQWHGTAYDYFRNEVLDANNWFNNAARQARLPERQNDFGGTLSGPVVIPRVYNGKDKTFFFFSYEALRLTVPQATRQVSVPDVALRQAAAASVRPYLNSFALPSVSDGLNDGLGIFNLAYSSPNSINSPSIRIDHSFGDKLRLFGRYAETPSNGWTYNGAGPKLTSDITVRTLTAGATSMITSTQANDLRFNFTQNNMTFGQAPTAFGGGTPFDVSTLPGPGGQPFPTEGSQFKFGLGFGAQPSWFFFQNNNKQQQLNVTDTYSWHVGAHNFKFGVDWRRLVTFIDPIKVLESISFNTKASLLAGVADDVSNFPFTNYQVQPVYRNFSSFVQDDWRASRRLSLSLGLRWDVNPAPGNLTGPSPYTVDQVTNLATAVLAPVGTPLWKTDWRGFAPRLGLAYQLRETPGHETVIRTGFGMFYDLGNTQGSQGFTGIGFTRGMDYGSVPFPLTSAQLDPLPPIVTAPFRTVYAFDPNLKLPYTMEWNVALEQALGTNQSLAVSYVGSAGRKLLTQYGYNPFSLGNNNFRSSATVYVTSNRASSDYNSLQVKYQTRFYHGLQALASYTWSHSLDSASTNFQTYQLLRSSSDFDIRHNFQAALTYNLPGSYSNAFASAVLKHWGLDARISARSALPVDIIGAYVSDPATQATLQYHPNLVPGQPLYVSSLQACPATAGVTNPAPAPGQRLINDCAFTAAPSGVDGNTPRNFARGFPAEQVNLALRRDFPITERLRLQFRAEAFNVFNHPIFGQPSNYLPSGPKSFGYAQSSLSSSLGGLNQLYQTGGPRSLQLMLKLSF